MAIDVFLSVGKPATEEQEAFIKEVELLLEENGFRALSLGRSYQSALQPLKAVEHLMDSCAGCVVVAFERLYVESGVELRGGPDASAVASERLTTVWNQIEATMAYVKRHPLLVIVEKGVKQQGLLSKRADWYVEEVTLDPAQLRTHETVGRLQEWKGRVVAAAEATPTTALGPEPAQLEKMTIGEIIRAMTLPQLWGAIIAGGGALVTAFLLGARVIP